MKCSVLSLQAVYAAIARFHSSDPVPPSLPRRGTQGFHEFRRAFEREIGGIRLHRAVYLWFSKGPGGDEFIYVGQTNSSSIGLRQRFADHFKQGYHIFWMTLYGTDRYVPEVIGMYRGRDYTKNVNNQTLRHGVTHIVYCGEIPSEIEIRNLEADLIQLAGNPRGNAVGFRQAPLAKSNLLPISIAIWEQFRNLVNETAPYEMPTVTSRTHS